VVVVVLSSIAASSSTDAGVPIRGVGLSGWKAFTVRIIAGFEMGVKKKIN
jgi:hypothetical protein